MSNYSIPLICAKGNVTEYNGSPVSPAVDLSTFIANLSGAEIENEESEEYYPDIVFTNFAVAPAITIAEIPMTAGLIAGSHPPYRPR